MRTLLIVTLLNILPAILKFINYNLGAFHLHGSVGQLPTKYTPLTEQDQHASDKAADFVDFIQLVPKIDPLERDILPPVGIDIPFLWLSGKVYMKNFVLAGVKQMVVHNVELRLQNYRTDINMSFPLLYVDGQFNLQAYLGFLPVFMRCQISLNLMDVDVSVSTGSKTQQASGVGEVLQVTGTDAKIDIRNVQFNLTDIAIGGSKDDVGLAVMQLFTGKSYGEGIFDTIVKQAIGMANQELLKVSTEVFKDYLLSTGY